MVVGSRERQRVQERQRGEERRRVQERQRKREERKRWRKSLSLVRETKSRTKPRQLFNRYIVFSYTLALTLRKSMALLF